MNTEEAHNICGVLTFTEEITARYDLCIEKMKKIITAINNEYKEK